MIESSTTSTMSELLSRQTHYPLSQDYRITTHSPQLIEDDLPGDLQSLTWLTSVDVPRLRQLATGRLDFNTAAQGSMLEQHSTHLNVSGGQGPIIHLQSNIQNRLLGKNCSSNQSRNLNGELVPGIHQSLSSLYQPCRQIFALAQPGQQRTSVLYSNTFSDQSPFSQPRLAPHNNQNLQPKSFPKPIYSYSCLIAMALKNSKTGSLPVSEIYSFMKEHFPYFKTAPDGWKNSVRHNLSLNKCFEKVENKMRGSSRKGCLWALNPNRIDKMEEEMLKWKRKDLQAICRSMANPDELDKLISERPDNYRKKHCDSVITVPSCPVGLLLPSQIHPQSTMSLSLQCFPLHHQVQSQTRLASNSSTLAQTSQHSSSDFTNNSPVQHPSKPPQNLYSLQTEISTEVDSLDPSIMDFDLQGNLWEDAKDESFSLETIGSFSDSPLQLSDSDIGPTPGAHNLSLSDLQVTGLYASYSTLDTVLPPCIGNTAIALL